MSDWKEKAEAQIAGPRYTYVIMAEFRDDETDAPLFWNNEYGWVPLYQAEVFTQEERVTYTLPVEAWGWLRTPMTFKTIVQVSLQALLDVAVAADKYIWSLKHGKTTEAMNCYCDGLNVALDKLREVSDGR